MWRRVAWRLAPVSGWDATSICSLAPSTAKACRAASSCRCRRTMSFYKNGQDVGVAFTHVPNDTVRTILLLPTSAPLATPLKVHTLE